MSQILSIDHGSKRIGLALADEEVDIASPYLTLENKGWQENIKNIKDIIAKEDVGKIVVGLPLSLSGRESDQTREAKKFFNLLKGNIDIPVVLEDERLSSKQVDSLIKKFKKKIDRDAVSAMLILQNFLDKQKLGM